MNERAYNDIVSKVPNGDWLRAGHWKKNPVYQRYPDAAQQAMETLATLATPEWFLLEAEKWCTIVDGRRAPLHPILMSQLHPDPLSFWRIFSVAYDLLTLENIRPIPARPRERPLADRLLESNEFTGVASELSAAARLKRGGIQFDWYPLAGGDLLVQGDVPLFVEVKGRSFVSDAVTQEITKYHELRFAISSIAGDCAIDFVLEPTQADGLSSRARSELWKRIMSEFVLAAQMLVEKATFPARHDLPSIGTLWIGRSRDEILGIGAGTGGLALDERAESRRAIRATINTAIGELPPAEPAVIYIEWSGARPEFEQALRQRLERLDHTEPRVTAVVIRGGGFVAGEGIPHEWHHVIEAPSPEGATSAVVSALCGSRLDALDASRK